MPSRGLERRLKLVSALSIVDFICSLGGGGGFFGGVNLNFFWCGVAKFFFGPAFNTFFCWLGGGAFWECEYKCFVSLAG